MANTRYSMIVKLLKDIDTKSIHLDKLKTLIKVHMATREIIVRDILKDMTSLGFIKEDSTKPFHYVINKNGSI